jgi:ABC-type transport system substrate-binding protein
MQRPRRTSLAARGILLNVSLLVGCDPPLSAPLASTQTETPRRGGTAEFATMVDIRSLDPAAIGDGIAPSLVDLLYAGLLKKGDNDALLPDLAERWTRDEKGVVYTFFLKEGARFHDGEEVTAHDVIRSFTRALDPKTPNSGKSFYFGVLGAEAFSLGKAKTIEGIEATGKYQVQFTLKEPDAVFPSLMTLESLRPVCKSAGDRFSDGFVPCGAGPFKLESWKRGIEVKLVRHDAYFRNGLPYLDGMRLRLGVSMQTQRVRFERGELDLLRDVTQASAQKFVGDPRWKPLVFYDPEVQMGGESMNVEMPPFDNVEVRRAVSNAINRDEHAKVKPSMLHALTQPVPQGVKGHNPALSCQSYDLTKAREHMARAGYAFDPATGKGGYPQVIPYYGYPGSTVEFTSQILAQQLRKIGIQIELRMVTYATWQTLTRRRKQVAFGAQGWRMDYSDPSNFTESIFHSNAISDEDSNNPAFYADAELDRQMEAAHRELNEVTRAEMYDRIQQRICEDAPWAFTFSVRLFNVRQSALRNYPEHRVQSFQVTEAWKAALQNAPTALGIPAPFGSRSDVLHAQLQSARSLHP